MMEFVLDTRRAERIGFPEAVYASAKSPAQIKSIIQYAEARSGRLLLTRLDEGRLLTLPEQQRERIDYDPISCTGFFGEPHPIVPGTAVVVVTAGTSDVPVALEAMRTLRFNGHLANMIADVGVAGLWRLMDRLDEIRAMPIVIVVAGMDAALPSVVAGLVSGCVIAVPTSVGYGVATGGHAALNAILASCAPGIVTVNIDNGYGAGCAALRVLNARFPAGS
jgi:NCAIR mutase (PurE)-related protein